MTTMTEDERMARDEETALAIYEKSIRQVVTTADANKFVAVAVESGDFEIDADELPAVDRLRARHEPEARVWLMRVGPEPAHRIGWFRHGDES
jgi:hypothetical protein